PGLAWTFLRPSRWPGQARRWSGYALRKTGGQRSRARDWECLATVARGEADWLGRRLSYEAKRRAPCCRAGAVAGPRILYRPSAGLMTAEQSAVSGGE